MNDGLDKTKFFNNVRIVAKQKDMKIGELESAAGVSLGYISRTNKDSGTKPGIDFVVNISRILGVSLDSLVSRDLSKMTPTEIRLVSFIEKMIRKTQDDELCWIRESVDELNTQVTIDGEGRCSHPLFTACTRTDSNGEKAPCAVFVSRKYELTTHIVGECFHFYMKNGTALYIMNVVHNRSYYDSDCVREIWMCPNGGDSQFVCFSDDKNEEIAKLVDSLYDVVGKSCMHPKFNQYVEKSIDFFMDDSESNEPEELDLGF